MKHIAWIIAILCLISVSAVAKTPAPAKAPTDAQKAALVVQSFLTLMDEGKYDEAFENMDFDALIKDQLKLDTSKMTPREKERQVKAYKNISKSMFISGKKDTKFRNFVIGAFKRTGDTAVLEIINKPPKGVAGAPTVRTFKMVVKDGNWKIYGIIQQAPKK